VNEFLFNGPVVNDGDQMVYDWFGMPAVSPKKVREYLAANSDATIRIDSTGGELTAASSIYTIMREHGNVTVIVDGLAASAASVVAMGGKVVKMSPVAMMMIHNAWSHGEGDYREMESAAEMLRTANEVQINAYATKTGKSREELQAMMDASTWMDAGKALENGFADEILFGEVPGQVVKAMQDSSMRIFASAKNMNIEQLRKAFELAKAEQTPGQSPECDWQDKGRALLDIENVRF